MLDWDSDSGTRIFIPYTLYCFKPTPLCVSLRVASSFFRADSNHPSMPVFLLSRSVDEMKRLEEMSGMFRSSGAERHPPEPKSQTEGVEDSGGKEQPKEHPGLISFRMYWLDLLAVQGTLKSLLQHHSSKTSTLRCSAFFTVQLSHPYRTGKTIALTRWTFVGKVMSLLLNMLSRLVITFI